MRRSKVASGLNTIAVAATVWALVGCNQQPSTSSQPPSEKRPAPGVQETAAAKAAGLPVLKPAEPNGFEAVAAKLDVGGPVFIYLSTEQLLGGLSTELDSWKGAIVANGAPQPEQKAQVDRIFAVAKDLLKKSGVEQLAGIGSSAFPVEKDLTRSKAFFQSKGPVGDTLLWNLFGAKAHPLDSLKLLPANTALAYFTDFDFALLWNFVKVELAKIEEPEIAEAAQQFPAQFEANLGLKWDDVLASLGNEYGVVLTLDQAKQLSIPMDDGKEPLTIKDPDLALVFRTKNDLLFKRLDAELGKAPPDFEITKKDEGDLKLRSAKVPTPIGKELTPTMVQTKDYLIISTSSALVDAMLASLSGKTPGLAATSAEFKRLQQNTPAEGNSFQYVNKDFGDLMAQIQKTAAAQDDDVPPELMERFFAAAKTPPGYGVAAHVEDGWVMVQNMGTGYGSLVAPIRALPGFFLGTVLYSAAAGPRLKLDEVQPQEAVESSGSGQ